MSVKRFVQFFDLHSGWDRRRERGQWVTRPTFSKSAWRVAMRFAQDFCPNIALLGGDQLNCGPISHWHKGRPILDEGFRLKDEIENLDEHILSPLETIVGKTGELIWMEGNHEGWILQHVDANPGLQGMIEPDRYLKLQERRWLVYSQGEIASIGKLHHIHGDKFFRKGKGGQHPAKALVQAYRRNMRAGHLHISSSATSETAIDAKDYHTGAIIPSLSTKNPAYNENNPNSTLQGFGYGYSHPNGDFNDYIVIVNNGKAIINGKLYDGNRK